MVLGCVGSMNHALDWGSRFPHDKGPIGQFLGKGRSIVKYRDALPSALQKKAELIEMPFGLWARVGPTNHVLDGGPDAPWEWASFWGKWRPVVKYRDTLP